ncbi:MAG: four helix bundle protein [Allosphingosinicella sp.]
MARDYRELEVWRLAMDMAEAAYRVTAEFPKTEEYRITSQLLRAAASVPANIAEGNARSTRKDYARFVSIARGSLAETETLLMLARRIGLGRTEDVDAVLNQADRVGRMLNGLHRSLENNPR